MMLCSLLLTVLPIGMQGGGGATDCQDGLVPAFGPNGPNGTVEELFTYERGGVTTLIFAGRFTQIGSVAANGLAEWDGQTFTPLASGFSSGVNPISEVFRDITSFDDGGGVDLYVGGYFSQIDGVPAFGIARWDGTSWSAVGTGIGDGSATGVESLLVHDDGSGPALYAVGQFPAGPMGAASYVKRWDGTTWSDVGSFSSFFIAGGSLSLVEFDSGGGLELYMGGGFVSSFNLYSPRPAVYRWDGLAWSTVGRGTYQPRVAEVMAVYGTGGNSELYVIGKYSTMTPGVRPVARLQNGAWLHAGSGLRGSRFTDSVVFDDGNGSELYLTGAVLSLHNIGVVGPGASWDGLAWQGMADSWPNPPLKQNAMAVFDDGMGPAIFIGGQLGSGPTGDGYVFRYRACSPGDDFCFADSSPVPGCEPCPCGNGLDPVLRGGCSNSVGTGARLAASGTNQIAAGDLRFELEAAVPNSVALLVSAQVALPAQGGCQPGNGVQSPTFDGLRCVGMGLLRHGTRATDAIGQSGVTTAGWGPPNGPMGGIPAQASVAAGQSRFFQVIYRDDLAASCGTGLNTSSAVRVLFR